MQAGTMNVKWLGVILCAFGLLNAGGCGSEEVGSEDNHDGLHVSAAQDGPNLVISLINRNAELVELGQLNSLAYVQGEAGLEFVVKDSKGRRLRSCAMIDPPLNDGGVTQLKSDQTKTMVFKLLTLKKVFCLQQETYEIKVLYHLGSRKRSYVSPPVEVDMALVKRDNK